MSYLGYASVRYPETLDKEAMKRNAYHDQGIVVVSVDDPRLTWPERELVKQLGDKLYGKRKD